MDRLEKWHVLMHSLAILRAVDLSLGGVTVDGDDEDEALFETIQRDINRLIDRLDHRVRVRLAELRGLEPEYTPRKERKLQSH